VPITPEKILKALDAKRAGKSPRVGPVRFPDVKWPPALDVPTPWEGGDGRAKDKVESEKIKVKSPGETAVPS
jgi:hypothetical protein